MGLGVAVPSDERRAALSAYVSELRGLMALGNWTVRAIWEYPDSGDDDVEAEITPTEGRYLASLRFGEGFWGKDPAGVRAVLVHELLHLHHARITGMVEWGRLKKLTGEPVHALLEDGLHREVEMMVDALTSVLVEYMPLPAPWPA